MTQSDPHLRISTLPNGLRVVTRLMPGLHSAAIGVWVSAGGRDEPGALGYRRAHNSGADLT